MFCQTNLKRALWPLTENYYTVELQWLEHLWDYENMLETGVVRTIEGLL